MRIAVLGAPFTPPKSDAIHEWFWSPEAGLMGDKLIAPAKFDVVDCDVFVADTDDMTPWGSWAIGRDIGEEIKERVYSGGVLVAFVGASDFAWIPIELSTQDRSGSRLTFDDPAHPVSRILERHRGDASYKLQFEDPALASWVTVARSITGKVVSGYTRYGRGLILLLPQVKRKYDVFIEVLREFLPSALPDLFASEIRAEPAKNDPLDEAKSRGRGTSRLPKAPR